MINRGSSSKQAHVWTWHKGIQVHTRAYLDLEPGLAQLAAAHGCSPVAAKQIHQLQDTEQQRCKASSCLHNILVWMLKTLAQLWSEHMHAWDAWQSSTEQYIKEVCSLCVQEAPQWDAYTETCMTKCLSKWLLCNQCTCVSNSLICYALYRSHHTYHVTACNLLQLTETGDDMLGDLDKSFHPIME